MAKKFTEEELTKIYGKMVCEQPIRFQDSKVFGDNKKYVINFKIFDGFAYCEDFNGDEYYLTYPKIDFLNSCNEMQQAIRTYMGLNESDKIGVVDILQSYCSLHKIENAETTETFCEATI